MHRILLACLLLMSGMSPAFADTVLSFSSYGSSDWIGLGETHAYTPSNAYLTASGGRTQVRVYVSGNDGNYWDLTLKAPIDDELRPREYFYAERAAFTTGRSPGLEFSGSGRGCNEVYGYFGIRQIAFDSAGNLTMLDASAIQYCESYNNAPLAIVIRWKAPYRSFSIDSVSSDYVGVGIKQSYYGDTSTFGISMGNVDYFHYRASGMRNNWSMTFRPPLGQTYFKKGTYDTLTDRSGTLAGMSIGCDGRGGGGYGRLTIDSIIYNAANEVTTLNADFAFYSDAARTKLMRKGRIRYLK